MDEMLTDGTRPGLKVDGDTAAAILLTVLGDDEAAAILSQLNPEEVKRVGAAMLDVGQSSAADIEAALDMFVHRNRATSALGIGVEPRVRSVFAAALGNVRADNALAEIAPQRSSRVLDLLRWMPAAVIGRALAAEHPQVAALILACLTPEAAALALARLDEERQADLIYRAACLVDVNTQALDDLEEILQSYSDEPSAPPSTRIGGRSEAAKIVTRLERGVDQRVLKSLKKRDKVLATEIEHDLLRFEDLAQLDTKNMGTLLRGVDTAVLTLALRGAEPPLVDQMLACLSERASQTIRDEMAESPRVKRSEVEEAQRAVAAAARALIEEGSIILMGGNGDDYV